MKELKFVKIQCKNCGFLNLIPVYDKLNVEKPIKCQQCGKIIIKKERFGFIRLPCLPNPILQQNNRLLPLRHLLKTIPILL